MTDLTPLPSSSSIQNRRPPKEFYSELDSVVEHQVKSREAFDRAINIAQSHGFGDFEIILFIKDYLKDKIPHTSLYRYINELSETKTESTFPLEQIDDKIVLLEDGMLLDVRVDEIKIGHGPREDYGDMGSLIGSIALHGLFHPIVINKDKLLICGFRRLKAYKALKWETIPAHVKDVTKNSEILLMQLHENTWLNYGTRETVDIVKTLGINPPADYIPRDIRDIIEEEVEARVYRHDRPYMEDFIKRAKAWEKEATK